jgi:hypothetical protein
MFLNKKDKKLEITNRVCFLQLKYIERRFDNIEQSLNEENINRNFEKILLDLHILKGQFSIITNYNHTSQIVRRHDYLNNRLYAIYDRIIEIGTKSKKKILNELYKIDTSNKTNDEIKKILGSMWDYLNLENVDMEDDITDTFINKSNLSCHVMGKLTNNSISTKQISSYESCINYAISLNTKEAVHSLYEFIDNYQYNIQEPFNSYERISIRIMIKVIVKSMK